MLPDHDTINAILKPYVQPWYHSLEDPLKAQEQALQGLLPKYRVTEYGESHKAGKIGGISDYQATFPIIGYKGLIPYLNEAK